MKNRTWAVLVSAVLSTTSLGFGQTAPAVPAPPPKVEVFAFTPVGDAGTSAWIGKGIQESLQGQISATGASLVMPSGQAATGGDPVAVAKAAGCNLAVVGTFQVNGGQIRANGHLIDVTTGATAGSFSATGKSEDLFKVEDALDAEMAKLLPAKPLPPVQAAPPQNPLVNNSYLPPAPATDQVVEQPTVTTYLPAAQQPSTTYVPVPDTGYTYPGTYDYTPYYTYGYDYPYAVYPYGFYPVGVYGGIGIYGGYGYGGRYYNHGGYYNGGYRGGVGSRYVGGTTGGHGGVSVHVGGGGGGFHGGGHR